MGEGAGRFEDVRADFDVPAHDRALTIATAIDPTKTHEDIVSPGHVFPLVAREGGVLVRAGHTEASVDLARMAGLLPAGVICEIMNDDGTMARMPDLVSFAQRHGLKMSLILTDIDHFKRVNDTYGHPVGDQVLRGVAKLVGEMVRKIDVVARYGGEEFAILMEGTDAEGALILAERIREEVKKLEFSSDRGAFSVTLSLGLADFPDDAPDKEALVERADQALYHAKHGGRDRSVTFRAFTAARASRKAS